MRYFIGRGAAIENIQIKKTISCTLIILHICSLVREHVYYANQSGYIRSVYHDCELLSFRKFRVRCFMAGPENAT